MTEGTSHFENDNVEGKCPSELGYIVGWVGGRVQGGTTIYVLRSCFPEQDILDKGSHGAIERGETLKDCLILIRQNTLALDGDRPDWNPTLPLTETLNVFICRMGLMLSSLQGGSEDRMRAWKGSAHSDEEISLHYRSLLETPRGPLRQGRHSLPTYIMP